MPTAPLVMLILGRVKVQGMELTRKGGVSVLSQEGRHTEGLPGAFRSIGGMGSKLLCHMLPDPACKSTQSAPSESRRSEVLVVLAEGGAQEKGNVLSYNY